MTLKTSTPLLLLTLTYSFAYTSSWSQSIANPEAQLDDSHLTAEQNPISPTEISRTKEIVVTATRTPREEFETPRAINIIARKEIENKNKLSIVDILGDKPGLWVEKRTTTTGDPVMRGLSGSNLLALIDYNTLSSFWGEGGFAGDDMYGKIDADSIQRIEVVRGPSSVLYGSNALGGVINFLTKDPPLDFTETGWQFGGYSKTVYGSAANESRVRQEMFGAARDFRYILGISQRNVNDVTSGRGGRLQTPTGGEDANIDLKTQHRFSETKLFTFSAQSIHRTNIRRFYKPNEKNTNDRDALAFDYKQELSSELVESVNVNFYHQDKQDQRFWLNNANRGIARTKTNSLFCQALSHFGPFHQVTSGISYQRDDGESADDEQFTVTTPNGTKTKPAPDTIWQDFGIYVQDEWEVNNTFSLITSLRHDKFIFQSVADQYYTPPGGWDSNNDEYNTTKNSFIGGIGALYRLKDDIHLTVNYARGYRLWAPKFGATLHPAFGVVVPTNGFLDPVTGDTYELGVKTQGEGYASSLTTYYTAFNNFVTTVPGTFNGSTWYDWNNDSIQDSNETVYVYKSVGKAYVYGVELEGSLNLDRISPQIGSEWTVKGGFAWNIGKEMETNQPIRHTQPARGILTLKWESQEIKSKPWLEISGDFVNKYSRIPADRIANDSGYRTDPQLGTGASSPLLRSDGHLPGYSVGDLRGGLNLSETFTFTMAIENFTNKKYRRAHSRWDESGTNIVFGVSALY